MFYGNSAVTTNQSSRTAVWDSNYKVVLHLDEGTGTTANDSTVNTNSATWTGGSGYYATGNVGQYAGNFNGSTYAKVTSLTGLPLGNSPRTFTGWFKLNGTQNGWLFSYGSLNSGQQCGLFWNGGNLKMNFWMDDYNVPVSVSVGVWYHVAFTYDGTTGRLYLNGSLVGSYNPSTPNTISAPFYLGQRGDNNEFLNGVLDEVHLSSVARSADWIAAEYNNQSNFSAFGSVGGPTVSSISPTYGTAGTAVTITGTLFGATQGTSTVTFNGTDRYSNRSEQYRHRRACADRGGHRERCRVTANYAASSGVLFTVTPNITSLSPTTGNAAAVVTITGTNFLATQGSNSVTFNAGALRPRRVGATRVLRCPYP